MLKFDLNVQDRRILVKRLEMLVGAHPVYTRAPFYAFEVGDYIVDHDGNLFIDETLAAVNILNILMQEGLISGGEIINDVGDNDLLDDTVIDCSEIKTVQINVQKQEETSSNSKEKDFSASEPDQTLEFPIDLDFPLSLDDHNGLTLRNLMNLIYSRASLINKATGSHFYVSKEFIETLKDDYCTYTIANFRKVLSDYAEKHGEAGYDGLKITHDQIIFSVFSTASDIEHLTAYGQLAVLMNYQAIAQRRILAKTIDETNEKYAMHIWLIRLGMNGDEFKKTRKILMENLSGLTSCRTAEQAEAARQKAFEKRHAEKSKEIIPQDEE